MKGRKTRNGRKRKERERKKARKGKNKKEIVTGTRKEEGKDGKR